MKDEVKRLSGSAQGLPAVGDARASRKVCRASQVTQNDSKHFIREHFHAADGAACGRTGTKNGFVAGTGTCVRKYWYLSAKSAELLRDQIGCSNISAHVHSTASG